MFPIKLCDSWDGTMVFAPTVHSVRHHNNCNTQIQIAPSVDKGRI